MLECYTTLEALPTATSTVRLSALVTGNSYRHSALLAKTVTTLDVVSAGRAIPRHRGGLVSAGARRPRLRVRDVHRPVRAPGRSIADHRVDVGREQPTFQGTWYRVRDAINEPRLRERIPVMIGGSGENKTFRLAARFAGHVNILCSQDAIARKVALLAQRCEEIGGDPKTLSTSFLISALSQWTATRTCVRSVRH
jgi:alkanesulfonate monooxygenase SsuD/methylene tetrahydromethanopterin reductase-like flavin-dependent oxidoreductase (luciferase family)